MKSRLQFPLTLPSSFSLERFQPEQSKTKPPSSVMISQTFPGPLHFSSPHRESQDSDGDFSESHSLRICIPDSSFNCLSPQDENIDASQNIVSSTPNLIASKNLCLNSNEDVQDKLENSEMESVSTQDEQSHSQKTSAFDKIRQISYRGIDKLRMKRPQKHKKSIKTRGEVQSKRVVEAVFNTEIQKVLMKVECCTLSTDIKYLTRDELLKEDPKLLLYFYESHLQFKRMSSFQASKLKTI